VGLQKSFLYNSRLEVQQVFSFNFRLLRSSCEISIFAGLLASPIRSSKQSLLSRALRRVSFLLEGQNDVLQGFFLLDPDAVGIFRGGNSVLQLAWTAQHLSRAALLQWSCHTNENA